MPALERHEVQAIADEAAEKAVAQTFRYFDVDVADPESVKSFRDGINHARSRATDEARKDDEIWVRQNRKRQQRMSRAITENIGKIMAAGLVAVAIFTWDVLVVGFKTMFPGG